MILLLGAENKHVVVVAVSVPILDLFTYYSRRKKSRVVRSEQQKTVSSIEKLIWLGFIGLTIISCFLESDEGSVVSTVLFVVPYALSLVFLERIVSRTKVSTTLLLLSVYVLVVAIYLAYSWDGFGRLLIAAYLLAPLLVANGIRDIGVRSWQAVILAPVLMVVSYYSRFKDLELKQVANDSSTSHLELTWEMLATLSRRTPAGFEAFVDQWLLIFLQWVPRSLWESKPIGLGSLFVDQWMGRTGFSDGHSIAIGFIGEQLWLLGHLAIVGGAIYFITLLVLRKFVVKLSVGHIAPVAVFDALLSTYLWGGGASFGARAWFFIIPMVVVILVWTRISGDAK